MTPRLGLLLLLITGSAALAPAHAADGSGNYAIWGAGGRSCNQFATSTGEATTRQPFRDYLMGYLTAYNTIAEDTYNALGKQSLDEAVVWLEDYCDMHRMDSFERAIGQLIVSRHSERQRGAGGNVPAWGRAPGPPE